MSSRSVTALVLFAFAAFSMASSHAQTAQQPPQQQQQQQGVDDPIPLPPTEQQQQRLEELGVSWFNRMVQALRHLNFDASLVHVQGDRVEPIRWLHGQDADEVEVELVMRLNGPDFRVLRFGDQTAYYQPAANSYSLRSNVVHGLIPSAFYEDFAELEGHYRALPVGGARVVDRDAQHIRLISRDNLRYGYSLWIDRVTGMLLKSAMVTPQGEVVEQMQLTSLNLSDRFPANLEELRDVPQPPLLYDTDGLVKVRFGAEHNWLPDGFKLLRSNHHRLPLTGAQADYYLFSDGLTEFSVYVSEVTEDTPEPLSLRGPDSVYTMLVDGFAVTVVGKLPFETAQRIADAVTVSGVTNP